MSNNRLQSLSEKKSLAQENNVLDKENELSPRKANGERDTMDARNGNQPLTKSPKKKPLSNVKPVQQENREVQTKFQASLEMQQLEESEESDEDIRNELKDLYLKKRQAKTSPEKEDNKKHAKRRKFNNRDEESTTSDDEDPIFSSKNTTAITYPRWPAPQTFFHEDVRKVPSNHFAAMPLYKQYELTAWDQAAPIKDRQLLFPMLQHQNNAADYQPEEKLPQTAKKKLF